MGRKNSEGSEPSHSSAPVDLFGRDTVPQSFSSKSSLFSDSNPFRRKSSIPLTADLSSEPLPPKHQLIDGLQQRPSKHQRGNSTDGDGWSHRGSVAGNKEAKKKKKRTEARNYELNGLNDDEGNSSLIESQSDKKRERNEAEKPKMVDGGHHHDNDPGEWKKKMKKEDKKDKSADVDNSTHRVKVAGNKEEKKKKKKKRTEARKCELKGVDDDEGNFSLPESQSEKKRERKEAENSKLGEEGLHYENDQREKEDTKNEDTRNRPPEVLKEEKARYKKIKPAAPYASSLRNEEGFSLGVEKNTNRLKSAMRGEKVMPIAAAGKDRIETEAGGSAAREMKRGKKSNKAEDKDSVGLYRERETDGSLKSRKSSTIQVDGMTENSREGPVEARKENGAENAENIKPGKLHIKKLKRTIFVGNLPLNTKRKVLMREFSQYGEVESVRVRSVPLVDTKLPRKAAVIAGHVNEARDSLNAYVVFKDHEAAKAALSHNMKEIYERHIRVDLAQPPHNSAEDSSSVKYDPTRSMFIGNLPFDAEDEELYELFSSGENPDMQVEAVRVVRDPQTSIGKGFAFVLFKTKAGVKFALSRGRVLLRERELRLRRISASNHSKVHSLSRSALQPVKIGHGFRERGRRLDGTLRKLRQENKEKSISRSSKQYEGFRSSLKEGKPARWTSSSQSRAKPGAGEGSAKKPHALDGSHLVARKKKRPAVAARRNPALKKQKTGSKDKGVKFGGASRRK